MGDPRLRNFVWDTPEEQRWRQGKNAALFLQELLDALEQQQWSAALEHTRSLLEAVEQLTQLHPESPDPYWKEVSLAIARLTAALHPCLHHKGDQLLPEPERSELCWQLTTLLDHALTTPAQLPPWVGVMHTQLLLHGALDWRERSGEAGEEGRRRMAHLLGRAAHRLDPLPPWVSQACNQLGVTPIADPTPPPAQQQSTLSEPPEGSPAPPPQSSVGVSVGPEGPPSQLWPPSQLAEELEHWLLDGGPVRQARLGLTFVPGAAMVCREGSSLDLNVAALLQEPSTITVDPWLEALRTPLQQAIAQNWLQQLELKEPFSSLYESLCHHWRLGGALTPEALQRLAAIVDAWNLVLGPGQIQAQRLPRTLISATTSLPETSSRLQVRLNPLELAALTVCDPGLAAQEPAGATTTETALAQLRREHHNTSFWAAAPPAAAESTHTPVEILRQLHLEGGFYASSMDPTACLNRWREGTLACLERAQIWGTERSDHDAALLGLGQQLTLHSGQLPCLRPRLPLLDLLERLGGREVLYVGWSWEAVLEQHRSGRAFRLFRNQTIVPYGLRVVPMPESRHPKRPQAGFRDSLDLLIAAVEQEHAIRPIDLLLVDEGAYRLPLLEAIERRHGIEGIAPGPGLLQLFGLERSNWPRWREEDRDPQMWRLLD